MFIVCGIVLIGLSTVSADEDLTGNNSSLNGTVVTVDPANNNAGKSVDLIAHVTSNSSPVTVGSVKFNVNGINAGTAAVNSGIATLNWLIPSNWNGIYTITADFDGTGTNYTNSTNTSNLTVIPRVMKAYWMRYDDVAPVSTLLSGGITDVFFLTRGVNGAYHYGELQWAINAYKPYGINVHAWIVCFKDNNQFRNPSGYYAYTNKIYVKTTRHWGKKAIPYYKKVRVGKYKVGKRWKYKYRYVVKYKYRKGWIYTPIYRYETVSGYDTSYNDRLVNEIANINNNYAVDGIHLDYVRYSGVASVGNAAWQQPGGPDAAVNAVTGFVQRVRGVVTKQLSAAVMPERDSNPSVYAQDYSRLSQYLDFIVPMTYEGNYNANNQWIQDVTNYIVSKANGKPVYAGEQIQIGGNESYLPVCPNHYHHPPLA
jgi:hypothetical protein